MQWESKEFTVVTAGETVLSYSPIASPNNPLYLLAIDARHVDNAGAAVEGTCMFYILTPPSRFLVLPGGYKHMFRGYAQWGAQGSPLPIFNPLLVRVAFTYCTIGDVLQAHFLWANKGEVL